MSSTNKTTNYELSQYIGTDKPTYLGDYNSDMAKIDAQMKLNATAASTADGKAVTADGKAVTALENASIADGKAVTAGETATSALNKALANETAIGKINGKTIITAKQSVDNTTYTSNSSNYSAKLNNWGVSESKGSNITFNSGNQYFVVGSGVSYVKVSGNLTCSNISNGTTLEFFVNVISNNESHYIGHSFHLAGSIFETLPIAPILLSVEEGDIIEFRIGMIENGKSATVKRQSYITIEEV